MTLKQILPIYRRGVGKFDASCGGLGSGGGTGGSVCVKNQGGGMRECL